MTTNPDRHLTRHERRNITMAAGYTVDEEKKQRIIEAHVKHGVPVAELATSYGLNRKTIYKWLKEAEPTATPAEGSDDADQGSTAAEEKSQEQATADDPVEDSQGDDGGEQPEQPDHLPTDEQGDEDELDDQAGDPEATAIECPNPSCGATFTGEECDNCGFRPNAAISLY
jgi:transposase-like protein